MSNLIDKIITLGGWFYISLAIALLLNSMFNKKRVLTIALVVAMGFSIIHTAKQITPFLPHLPRLMLEPQEFLNRTTQGQFEHAKRISSQKLDGHLCVPLEDDVTSSYLVQALYPSTVSLAYSNDLESCDHVIHPQP